MPSASKSPMMPRQMGRRSGLTLTELVVVTAIGAVVLGATMRVLGTTTRQWGARMAYGHAVMKANLAMERICKEIHNAVSFKTTTVGGNTAYAFTMPNATDAAGNYVPQIVGGALTYGAGTQVLFYLSDTTGSLSVTGGMALWRAALPVGASQYQLDKTWSLRSATAANCNNIQNLTITADSTYPNLIHVSLTATSTSGHNTNTQTITRQVYMANYNVSNGSSNNNSNNSKHQWWDNWGDSGDWGDWGDGWGNNWGDGGDDHGGDHGDDH